MEKYFKYLIAIFILSIASFAYASFYYNGDVDEIGEVKGEEEIQVVENIKHDRIVEVEITDGSTYGSLMEGAGISGTISTNIYDSAIDLYDLSKIRLGRTIKLIYDSETDEFKELDYQISVEEMLYVKKDDLGNWIAEKKAIEYDIRIKTASGVVKSSMYAAALENNIDERAIVELANAFQWTIDFSNDPRVYDTFDFVYEELYLNGEYIMPGSILAGVYNNAGEIYEIYYFEENEDNKGYFDKDGNSVQKMFLKAPVEFKYVSSGFTTGQRYVEAYSVSTKHRAIDYAANPGTPIRSVGDGTVAFAGWSPVGYGNLVKIRHNSTYSTNYAHQSKLAVKTGQKVKQGQIIGYVGSTGFSTGPHLHYEMVKDGVKINPLKEILPPGTPIKDENKERFFEEMKKYKEMIIK